MQERGAREKWETRWTGLLAGVKKEGGKQESAWVR